jgi:NodT family efflux transporter outer membrane factor (OMF) lipoprotein
MLPIRSLALFFISSLSVGCAAGPDYVRPGTPVPDRYQSQAAVEQRRNAHAANLMTWWEGFEDPKLTGFVKLAQEQNLDLAQALARVAQARAGLGAANAALLPSAAVSGQAARAYQSVETLSGRVLNATPNFGRYNSAYEVNLEAGWELDLFGGLRRGREAAQADVQASEAAAIAVRLTVAAQTADTYITIRGLQRRLAIAQRQAQTQQELLSTTTLLYGKGLVAEFQVRQAEGALAQIRASIPVIEAGLDAAMNAMDVMLGSQPGTHRVALASVSSADIPIAPQLSDAGSPGDLLKRRPDLLGAERRLAASNARIGVAISEYYPKLSLTALLGSATTLGSGSLFTSGASHGAGVLGLRWRLFDFGRINAQIALAKGQEAEALAAYRLAVLRAAEDVENAFSALVNREEQADMLAHGLNALRQARGALFVAYQKGAVSLIEVLQADDNLLRVSDAHAQAQTESALAAVSAFKALGGGWQPQQLE